MTEERRVQLVAEVDTTRTRTGFNEIGQQANAMAQQVTRSGEQAERAVSGIGSGAGASSQRVDAASRSIVASIQRTTVAMEAGGRQTAQYYELMARQRGIDPNTLRPYLDQLRAVEQAQARAAASGVVSAGQIANAMRMVPAQLTDVATQLAGGQSPFLVLLQQGGQLRDQFGSIPATIRGVGSSILGLVNPTAVAAAAVGALAYAYSEGSKEADAYNRAIIMSGNAAGTSAGQLADYARSISQTIGTQGAAAAALAELASTGEVSANNMREFGAVTVAAQKYIGISAQDMAKNFADLGKAPVASLLKLDETYHFLTASTYEQVKALQDQGKNEDAAEVAQKAYASAFASRADQMKESLGSIERAWMGAKDSAALAWDMFLGVGRKETAKQALAKIQEQIKLASAPPVTGGGDRGDNAAMRQAAAASNLPELRRQEREAQWRVDKEEWDNQQAAISDQLRKASLEWDKIMDGTLSKAEQKKRAIERVVNAGVAAGAPQKQIDAAVRKVEQDYASLDNPLLAQLQGQSKIQKAILAGDLETLESNYKQRLISESQYIEQKRDLQLQENKIDIDLMKKQAEIDHGKEDQSAYKKDLADLAVLVQQRLNIANGATNALANAEAARKKGMDDLVAGWDRTIAAQAEAAQQELDLFGKSDQARQVAIAQIKLESEARKFVEQQARDGHALSEQEVADLNEKTEARKRELAVVMNREAAIAGARQLLQENRKFAADYIFDSEARSRRMIEIEAEEWRERIRNAEEGSAARRLIEEQFDQWMANRQMQPVLDRWKGVIDNLDNNFQEGFRDMLTGGQSAWSSFAKSIANTLKTSLADALYQVFVKKYVVQVVASLAGAISGPAVAGALDGQSSSGVGFAGGGASGNSAISAAQAASSLYKAISGGFETLSTSVADAVQAGMYQSGMTTQIASNGAFATGVGTAAGYGAGLLGGHYIGNAIAGDYSVNHGQAVTNIASGIGAAIAGPIGAVIGGTLGGLFNRAFGRGPTEVQSSGLRGMLSADGVTGESYQNLHQDGGWFRSDKNWTDAKALTDDMVKQFTGGITALETASSGFASALGVQADWISTYSKSFDLKLTGDQTKDQQIIADFFASVGDDIANKLVPRLADFAKSGEAASATLERLAGDFKGTDQIAQLLGRSASTLFGATGIESAKARESLIDFAGGLSTLSSEASFFNQNFLTDAERIKPVADALDNALASLGLDTIPATRDEFKGLINSLIDSGAAATDAGGKQLTSLLALAEAFAQVHPQIDATADAVEKAADALQAMKDSASTLLGGVDSAFTALQKVVAREKAAVQASVTAQTAAVSKLQTLSQALRSTLDSLKSPDQKAAERASAQAQIRAALAIAKAGGALPTADSLKSALSVVTRDSADQFATHQDYLRDLYQTQNDISQLGDITDDQLSVAEKSLDALQDQLKSLDDQLEAAQEQIDILKGIDTNGLSLLDAMRGLTSAILQAQSNPIVGATSAINGAYQSALHRAPDAAGLEWWQNAAANGAPVSQIVDGIKGSTEATLNTLYRDVLGRAPDAEGLAFWMKAYGNTMDSAEQADWLKAAQKDPGYKIPGFAGGGDFAGGLRWVGEIGPEMEATGAARIHSTRALIDALRSPASNADALAAAVDRLTAQVAAQQEIIDRQGDLLRAIAGHTSDTASHLDDVINGRKPIPTESV